MFRARKRRNHTDDDVEALKDPETDRNAGHNHMRERLLEAMAQLEPEQAEMLVLCYEHGYSDAQIAEMLGRKRGAVAMTLNRARARLKELMGEESKEVGIQKGYRPVHCSHYRRGGWRQESHRREEQTT